MIKSKYILAWIFCLTILISAKAQDSTATAKLDTETGQNETIFNTPVKNTRYVGCSLVQNDQNPRKIDTYKNGYKIVTEEEDEVIEVRNQNNGDTKINYYNGYEDLKYHRNEKGETHYKYSYYNECKKVKVRKNKKGITSITNKSGDIDANEVKENVDNAIKKGVNSCASTKYSK